ncbi:MAG: carbohydrate ABC transporter permease [Sphaerochaetaceae bacterium]|nr:carbohydrate ABC transporter permease [Sphaerochaetaceae bacterium]MDD4396494.1 carbohydrate ABC transporter permease [Sphaerochaetaceae bacterium]
MTRTSPLEISRRNIRCLSVMLACLALFFVIMALPLYTFTTDVFSKRVVNIEVGDAKYNEARSLAENELTLHSASDYGGGTLELVTDVTERTSNAGAVSKTASFRVVHTIRRSGFALMGSALPGSWIPIAIAVLCCLSLASAAAGTLGNMQTDCSFLDRRSRTLRLLSSFFALAAMLLVPILSMKVTYTLQRQLIALMSRNAEVSQSVLDSAQNLIYGQTFENGPALIKSLSFTIAPWYWILVPSFFVMLTSGIMLGKGTVGHSLAMGGKYFAAIVLCVVILYPYYVMLVTGFRSNAETTDMFFSHIFPVKWVWSNIVEIMSRGVPRYLLNSLALSFGATALAMVCGIPAAYALARMSFKGKKGFLGFVIMSQMFAPVVLLVGISQLMNAIGLNDTIFGLMLINAAFNQAFAIWLLRGTFVSISPEMEQAACIDGCSTFGALTQVLLPMAAPGIVTTLIFVFINAWNEYTISTVLISTASKKPITVGITQFSSFNMIEWQYLFASSLIATIPVIILFMLIEKHLVSGLTSGGVKG